VQKRIGAPARNRTPLCRLQGGCITAMLRGHQQQMDEHSAEHPEGGGRTNARPITGRSRCQIARCRAVASTTQSFSDRAQCIARAEIRQAVSRSRFPDRRPHRISAHCSQQARDRREKRSENPIFSWYPGPSAPPRLAEGLARRRLVRFSQPWFGLPIGRGRESIRDARAQPIARSHKRPSGGGA
jgi:hypothetical protein